MEQVRLSEITVRTFGWIQNPGDFNKLKKVVQIFDHTSSTYNNLITDRIPRLVEERDGRDTFIDVLSQIPLKLKYRYLTGSAFTPRSSARCNGIVQAIVEGQGNKEFVDDWSADGFIRWAHALGFIDYEYLTDSFSITQLGFDYSKSIDGSLGEKEVLVTAMLSYPPAVRVLDLLSNGDHLTKYEIGKKLGFSGESGFTSLPQDILIQALATCNNPNDIKKMKSDWDGSSDKYARMIGGWLNKLGLVSKVSKDFIVNVDGLSKNISISHAFKIKPEGLKQLRKAKGINKVSRTTKRVHWEMLATKKTDRVYIRTRRAYILKILENSNGVITLDKIKNLLDAKELYTTIGTIKEDINGLINIGLNIEITQRGVIFKDTINDFTIPSVNIETNTKSLLEDLKSSLLDQLTQLSLDYLQLIDLSQDPKQNRLFEMKVLELFLNEFGFKGSHLGGGRKPDGIIYNDDFGIIIDTKAYKDGYSLPISQADEMERYVRENIDRNDLINPNKWWSIFPKKVSNYNFLFISGFFKGNFEAQLDRISLSTGTVGAVINVENLLLAVEYYKRGIVSHDDFKNKFCNKEIQF